MGMRFLDSILSLLTAAAVVFSAYLVGHALSNGASWAWIGAAVLLVAGVILGWFTTRRVRGYAASRGEPLHD